MRCVANQVHQWIRANGVLGSARMDNLPCGGRALQNAAHRVPEDWARVGDPWRPWVTLAPQRGGKRGLSALPRRTSLCGETMAKADGDVLRGRRFAADASNRYSGSGIPVRGVHRDDGKRLSYFHHCVDQLTCASVSNVDWEGVFQDRSSPWPCKNIVYATQYGSPGPDTEDHGELSTIWATVQGGGLRLLIAIAGGACTFEVICDFGNNTRRIIRVIDIVLEEVHRGPWMSTTTKLSACGLASRTPSPSIRPDYHSPA